MIDAGVDVIAFDCIVIGHSSGLANAYFQVIHEMRSQAERSRAIWMDIQTFPDERFWFLAACGHSAVCNESFVS